jgi:hypothetical protein
MPHFSGQRGLFAQFPAALLDWLSILCFATAGVLEPVFGFLYFPYCARHHVIGSHGAPTRYAPNRCRTTFGLWFSPPGLLPYAAAGLLRVLEDWLLVVTVVLAHVFITSIPFFWSRQRRAAAVGLHAHARAAALYGFLHVPHLILGVVGACLLPATIALFVADYALYNLFVSLCGGRRIAFWPRDGAPAPAPKRTSFSHILQGSYLLGAVVAPASVREFAHTLRPLNLVPIFFAVVWDALLLLLHAAILPAHAALAAIAFVATLGTALPPMRQALRVADAADCFSAQYLRRVSAYQLSRSVVEHASVALVVIAFLSAAAGVIAAAFSVLYPVAIAYSVVSLSSLADFWLITLLSWVAAAAAAVAAFIAHVDAFWISPQSRAAIFPLFAPAAFWLAIVLTPLHFFGNACLRLGGGYRGFLAWTTFRCAQLPSLPGQLIITVVALAFTFWSPVLLWWVADVVVHDALLVFLLHAAAVLSAVGHIMLTTAVLKGNWTRNAPRYEWPWKR